MIDFITLLIWQRSHSMVLNIYKKTYKFLREEIYGLTSQIRRSAASIATNIAEGCGRNSDAELARFLTIAMGSSAELEYQTLLAKDLKYINDEEYKILEKEIIEIRKMMNTFLEKVNSRKRLKKTISR